MLKRNCLILLMFFSIVATAFVTPVSADQCPTIFTQNTKGEFVPVNIDKIVEINKLSTDYSNNTNNLQNNADDALKGPDPDGSGKIVTLYITTDGVITSKSNGNKPLTRAILLERFGTRLESSKCPASIRDLQSLFLRLVVIVNSIIGVVIFYVIGKAAVIRMTSRGNPEAVKKSIAMMTGAVVGLAIVLGAYVGIVFLGERLLPPNDCYKYSFVDSGRILFFFDQSDVSPVLLDEYKTQIQSLPAKCRI